MSGIGLLIRGVGLGIICSWFLEVFALLRSASDSLLAGRALRESLSLVFCLRSCGVER